MRSTDTSAAWLSAHPSACLPQRSKSSRGERSWVTISPNTTTTARQPSAQARRVIRRDLVIDQPRGSTTSWVMVSITLGYHLPDRCCLTRKTDHLACVR